MSAATVHIDRERMQENQGHATICSWIREGGAEEDQLQPPRNRDNHRPARDTAADAHHTGMH